MQVIANDHATDCKCGECRVEWEDLRAPDESAGTADDADNRPKHAIGCYCFECAGASVGLFANVEPEPEPPKCEPEVWPMWDSDQAFRYLDDHAPMWREAYARPPTSLTKWGCFYEKDALDSWITQTFGDMSSRANDQ